ncbi:MAG: NAD(P)/FAD-dependent oxidoreductase [Bacteroidales bacterium]|nr:NAD(P)/FAD-dependent oxidoreductase [Bacteroidales bacterium]
MGYEKCTIKLPTDFSEGLLRKKIRKQLRIKEFSYQLENKSLDARNKSYIHWLVRVMVTSPELKGGSPEKKPELEIPYKKRTEKAIVVGSGPAGFFAAFTLQKAGFQTTIIERGTEVNKRAKGIQTFEKTGVFNPVSNYTFGEGGAGTFSDGKLTSRSKHISLEKQYILSSYIRAGAPGEIGYMAHPHLGNDNLKVIVKNLRHQFEELGGTVLFETFLKDMKIENGTVKTAITESGEISADVFFIAPGHSAYETYRMLIRRGIPFRTKNFAIGSRMEHRQEIINLAQWGAERLKGVKAAEYRLTSSGDGNHRVYSFCMCPGGIVVPATAYKDTNIVNGMSLYNRDGEFANAACVAGIHPDELAGREVSPLEALDFVETLERKFYDFSGGYKAPFCNIQDFINKKKPTGTVDTSYPMGLNPAPLWELLPEKISRAMLEGLKDFCRKINGFDTGNLLGLESKTSAPVQVIREQNKLCTGFKNLYIIGEGSGYAGGIISSAADGVKAAISYIGQ